jgi:tetratricopeptide (TPR) repeat protein
VKKLIAIITAALVPVFALAIRSDEEIIAIVRTAENGEGLDEAINLLNGSDDFPPLADAALGRLWAAKAARTGFSLLKVLRAKRGLGMLDDYLAKHPDDPYALLWRGRSAVETDYLIAGASTAEADLKKALDIFGTEYPDAEAGAACCLGLGNLAFDLGDLEKARTYWELAVTTAPETGPAEDAAEMLRITQG